MNSTLFGLSTTTQALVLSVLVVGALLVVIGMGIVNPLLWRMGLRNVLRRRAQTLIMLCGLLFSAIFITTSFGLQDSIFHSLQSDRLAKVGNVDESVTGPFTQAQVDGALMRIRRQPQVQAATAISLNSVAAQVKNQRTGAAAPNFYVLGVPPDFGQVYGQMSDEQGNSIPITALRTGEVLLSHSSATALDVRAGDHIQITLTAQNATLDATVRAILSTDPVVTSGELSFDGQYAEVILPLATLQQTLHQAPNTICIKNIGQGGMDDIGPNGSRSRAVVAFLGQLFQVLPDTHGSAPTYFDHIVLHALKPDWVEDANWNPLASKGEFIASPAARQFDLLLPTFTGLLVGAGMLLLVLLVLLLAADRRAELGLSRAVGLPRSHLVQSMLIECSGYALIAAVLGIPLGLGLTALELFTFGHLPVLSVLSATGLPLHIWISWQSILSSVGILLLTTMLLTLVTAFWISRMSIVAAIRNLDEAPRRIQLHALLHDLRSRPLDVHGQAVETATRAFGQRAGLLGRLLWELILRGPLSLVIAGLILLWGTAQGIDWLAHLGIVLLIAGTGLLVAWLGQLLKLSAEFSRWLSGCLMGLGWLIYGLQIGTTVVILNFASDISSIIGGNGLTFPSFQDILFSLLLPLIGLVVLVMSNADSLALLLNLLLQRVRGLAPISRTSLVYPLTFRFRTGVAVALLSLVVFLLMLVMTSNLGIGQQQVADTTQKVVQSLVDQNAYTAGLTRFLVAYLVMGILFGALSLGVIASRAVVERRQQIGMLRALGFSPALVRGSFLLEAGFVVTLSVFIGTALAWWLVLQIARATSQAFQVPVLPTLLLLLGSYLVVFLCTFMPANRASHLPPAEALRYE